MKEVAIETQASIDAGEDGAMYWDAVFIPELMTILQVTAMNSEDVTQAVEQYKLDNICP